MRIISALALAFIASLSLTTPSVAQAPAAAPAKTATDKAAVVAAMDKLMSKLEEFSTALETVKDAASAEAAKPKLTKLNKEIESLSLAAAAVGEPTPAMRDEIYADPKLQARAQAMTAKLSPLTQRVAASPAIMGVLLQTMKDFQHAAAAGTAKAAAPAPAAAPAAKPSVK